ncbi:MAG: FtsX-like permease family protein [Chloroflexi bacterium]|nr:FtsX-like permease family protein [Chloroflexota bacterium]
MILVRIVLKSAWHRRTSLILTILSIAISVSLLLGVDKIRKEAKNSFINTISQTDLIVGARSGPTNLLLYSVFRIGNATNNVSWESYEEIAAFDEVAWVIPISLGDSHNGYRVMGTSTDYFDYFKYGQDQNLSLAQGQPFADLYDAVIGADVAQTLDYQIGDEIIIAHGLVSTEFAAHDDKPFTVVGILAKTGTPVDRTVHISLEGIEAIHVDWQSGTRSPIQLSAEQAQKMDLQPQTITAFMIGLDSRINTFRLQRKINEYDEEPLLAIIPGATLAELWQAISVFEQVLLVISGFVLIAGLLGMLTTLLSTLNERRREIAVLRAIGAHPYHIILLFVWETFFIVLTGCLVGVGVLYLLLFLTRPFLIQAYGFNLAITPPDSQQWILFAAVLLLGVLVSLIPGVIAYKRSLQDGLAIKI